MHFSRYHYNEKYYTLQRMAKDHYWFAIIESLGVRQDDAIEHCTVLSKWDWLMVGTADIYSRDAIIFFRADDALAARNIVQGIIDNMKPELEAGYVSALWREAVDAILSEKSEGE